MQKDFAKNLFIFFIFSFFQTSLVFSQQSKCKFVSHEGDYKYCHIDDKGSCNSEGYEKISKSTEKFEKCTTFEHSTTDNSNSKIAKIIWEKAYKNECLKHQSVALDKCVISKTMLGKMQKRFDEQDWKDLYSLGEDGVKKFISLYKKEGDRKGKDLTKFLAAAKYFQANDEFSSSSKGSTQCKALIKTYQDCKKECDDEDSHEKYGCKIDEKEIMLNCPCKGSRCDGSGEEYEIGDTGIFCTDRGGCECRYLDLCGRYCDRNGSCDYDEIEINACLYTANKVKKSKREDAKRSCRRKYKRRYRTKGDRCEHGMDPEDCLSERGRLAVGEWDEHCSNCSVQHTYKQSAGEAIAGVFAAIAGPAAYFGVNAIKAKQWGLTQQAQINAYSAANQACYGMQNNYINTMYGTPGLPQTYDGTIPDGYSSTDFRTIGFLEANNLPQTDLMPPQCNNQYASGFAGIGAGSYGGFGGVSNPFYGAGYSPGMMYAMGGGQYGGYGSNGSALNPLGGVVGGVGMYGSVMAGQWGGANTSIGVSPFNSNAMGCQCITYPCPCASSGGFNQFGGAQTGTAMWNNGGNGYWGMQGGWQNNPYGNPQYAQIGYGQQQQALYQQNQFAAQGLYSYGYQQQPQVNYAYGSAGFSPYNVGQSYNNYYGPQTGGNMPQGGYTFDLDG